MEGDGHYYWLPVVSTLHFQRPMYLYTGVKWFLWLVKICDENLKHTKLIEKKASINVTIFANIFCHVVTSLLLQDWLSHWRGNYNLMVKTALLFIPQVGFVLTSIWQQQLNKTKHINQQDNSFSDSRWSPQLSPRCLPNQDLWWRVGTIRLAGTQLPLVLL